MSFLEDRLRETVEVEPWAPTVNSSTGMPQAAYGPAVKISAVVSSQTSDESIDVGSNVMSRRLIVRVFGGTSVVTAKSRVKCRGEMWQVDGMPVTSKGVSRLILTTFYLVKQGVN